MFFVVVISRLYSAVSLTLVREQRFIRIVIIILADLYRLEQKSFKKEEEEEEEEKANRFWTFQVVFLLSRISSCQTLRVLTLLLADNLLNKNVPLVKAIAHGA